jgi:phage terminase large subunit
VFHRFDYSLGCHEILLSGSVGSGKSLPAAHIGLRHLFTYSGARLVLARRALPDLRDTIFTKVVEHLDGTVKADGTLFREGKDYFITRHNCQMSFANGSSVIARSWADKRYSKVGSIEASMAIVEEASENTGDDEIAFRYLRTRVGRLPHIPQQLIIYPTNPESPAHFLYKYFNIGKRRSGEKQGIVHPTRHVYFSLTEQNKYLPAWYINQLKQDLDPKLAQRLLYGKWIEIAADVIYHQYSESRNFRDEKYAVDLSYPIYISWDFNIAIGKPLSLCLSQVKKDAKGNLVFHFFNEVVVEGASTEEACQELADRGLLDFDTDYIVHGDATGGSRATKSKSSDYDIINKFLANYRSRNGQLSFKVDVGTVNPPVRTRHNIVNAYCKSESGDTKLYVYKDAPTLNKGMRLTTLRKGGSYIEDDSKPEQHVTTALGYNVCRVVKQIRSNESGMKLRAIR